MGWYPYPFFDLDTNGLATVAAYTAGLYAFGIIVIAGVRLSGKSAVGAAVGAVAGRSWTRGGSAVTAGTLDRG